MSVDSKKSLFLSKLTTPSSAEASIVSEAREEARKSLESLDFPTTRDEYYKYTRTAKILGLPLDAHAEVANIEQDSFGFENWNGHTLVFINGAFSKANSTMPNDEVQIETNWSNVNPSILETGFQLELNENQAFTHLNTAFHSPGVVVFVPEGVEAQYPIRIVHLGTGGSTANITRNVFVAEKGSKVEVVEQFLSKGGKSQFIGPFNEMYLHEGSAVSLYQVIDESNENYHLQTCEAVQERNSTLKAFAFTLSGKLVRHNWNIAVKGEGCQTELYGILLGSDSQHIDHHTFIDHQAAHCDSKEDFKGVFGDKSTGVFNGKVRVCQDAQKINAFQSNQNVLLSDDATINSKPELEIYADDVKCSHGSTTGQMDEEALFYLRSRGISKATARKIMVRAFISDVLEFVENDEVREHVQRQIDERFESAKQEKEPQLT